MLLYHSTMLPLVLRLCRMSLVKKGVRVASDNPATFIPVTERPSLATLAPPLATFNLLVMKIPSD